MKRFLLSLTILSLATVGLVVAKGGPPINDACPVDGKPARPIYRVFTEEGTVAFCCVECTETFKKNPARFPVKKK